MAKECSFEWSGLDSVAGSCLRPGGSVLTRKALQFCKLNRSSRVIDIGCGVGGSLEVLDKTGFQDVMGIDSSATLLGRAANKAKGATLVQGNAEAMPLKTSVFDAIFCECVLSILADKTSALCEFARILRNDGMLIMSDVFLKNTSGKQMGTTENTTDRLFGKEEVMELVSQTGFSIELWEEHGRALKEFAARMILAGTSLPALWGCSKIALKEPRVSLSYFLLIAKKTYENQTDRMGGIKR